jgi:hypothetical protein
MRRTLLESITCKLLRIGSDLHSKGLEERLMKSVREAMMPKLFRGTENEEEEE